MKSSNITMGIVNEVAMPANAVVLTRNTTKNGENVVEFVAVEGVRSTKDYDIILPLLALYVADARERLGFKTKFDVLPYTIDGEQVHSGINARSMFTKFLSKNFVVYKTDNMGTLKQALVFETALNQTALSVKATHATVKATTEEQLKIALINQAKAIAAQTRMFRDIALAQKVNFELTAEEKEKKGKAA